MNATQTAIKSLAIITSILHMALATADGQTSAMPRWESITPFVPNEILVQFKPDVTDAQIQEAFSRGFLSYIKQVHTPAMEKQGQIGLTRTTTSLPLSHAIDVVRSLPGVSFAQPNWIYSNQAVANDPYYLDGSLWGMFGDDLPLPSGPDGTTNPFGSQAESAWASGVIGSPSVFVAIVDTSGIQTDHPDLAPNVWNNPGEIPGNLLDDDGDGYIDDINGWNAYSDKGNVYETTDAHGTHVTGTLGAVGGNGLGVAGINWNVGLVSGKFGTNGSGTTADAIQAIDYVTTLRTHKGLNVVAINASWGTRPGSTIDQALLNSVSRAAAAGILFISAAMNNNTNTDLFPVNPACLDTTSTAGYDSVISVAAIDSSGNKASFSNYGQTSVDLGAPGVTIYSTKPGGTYGAMSGTSMATPHVAGAIALYASTHPGATADQTRTDLFSYGLTPTVSLAGLTSTGGRLNVRSLLASPARDLPPPVAPTDLLPTVISASLISLAWSDQSDNELGFVIERSTNGQSFALVDTVGANMSQYADKSARPNSTYYYRILSFNPGGNSAYVLAPAPVTTPNVQPPSAPSSLIASAKTPKQGGGILLSWSDNSSNEDGFIIERRLGTPGSWQPLANVNPNTKTYTDSAVVARSTYYYRVRAFNGAGYSAYSNEAQATAK